MLVCTRRPELPVAAVKKLDAANRKAEAAKVRSMVAEDKNRDLVIELSWAGPAGLDLRVKEPIGTVCSCANRVTTGGGALREAVYDPKEESRSAVYTASKAFDGTYSITADLIWGRPQGEKAQMKVIRHQGMANERVEYYTIDLAHEPHVKLTFDGGRRKDLAVLPSPVDRAKYRTKASDAGEVMNKLRALVSGTGSVGVSGGTGSAVRSTGGNVVAEKRLGAVHWLTRLGDERSVGMDIRSETIVRTDGTVEVKAAPVFDSLPKDVRAKIDLIPGGSE